MKASDVMTSDVVSIKPEATILDAVQLMLERRISGLPVIDASGTLVGMVTEGDFLRRRETGTQRKRGRLLEFLLGPGRLAEEYIRASGRQVDEVMTRGVRTVEEDAPLEKIVYLMERHRIKRIPVTQKGKIVGIVTRANLMRAVATLALEARPVPASDSAIRQRLIADLKSQSWAPVGAIDVVVTDGVVKLTGALTDERERQALRIAAENIPGVMKVEDHLIWVEPYSGMIVEAPED
jgi:CBS-domain-containing membrane protein